MSVVKMPEKDNSNLLKPGSAVEDFLDALLQESTEPTKPEKKLKLKTKSKLVLLPEFELNNNEEIAENKIDQNHINREEPDTVLSAEEDSVADKDIRVKQENEQTELSVIEYKYSFPLQCLMFSVAGSQLSIPLIDLGSVIPWGERLTRIPGSPDWFLGILQHREMNIKVADTAQIIQVRSKADSLSEFENILVFGDNDWAITCDKLGNVVYLNEEDVKWSKLSAKALSLGTIKQSLAILLDPKKILNQLNKRKSDIKD